MDLFIAVFTTVIVVGIAFGVVYLLRLVRWIWRLPGRLWSMLKRFSKRSASAQPAASNAQSAPTYRVIRPSKRHPALREQDNGWLEEHVKKQWDQQERFIRDWFIYEIYEFDFSDKSPWPPGHDPFDITNNWALHDDRD